MRRSVGMPRLWLRRARLRQPAGSLLLTGSVDT
jgi:hypothetical protein